MLARGGRGRQGGGGDTLRRMADRHLYLIRHGQYDRARESPTLGRLTPLGRRQARHLAKALRTLPVDVIHHSTLVRAQETAEILGEVIDAPMTRSSLLREGLPGMRGKRPIAVQRATMERFDRALAKFFKRTRGRDRHELIVCHGNLIRYVMLKALEVDTRAWARIQVPCFCSVTRMTIRGRTGWKILESYGDASHLPVAARLRF